MAAIALLISNAQVFSGNGIEGQAKAMARGQMRGKTKAKEGSAKNGSENHRKHREGEDK